MKRHHFVGVHALASVVIALACGSCGDGGDVAGPSTPSYAPPPTGSRVQSPGELTTPVSPPAVAPIRPGVGAKRHPPPISGGTLIVTRDGSTAVAADPDFDRVYVVDLTSGTVRGTAALRPDDEPGRLVEDGDGRIHVVLRRAGAIVTVDPTTAAITARRAVCPAPRGIAWDARGNVLHVACAGGELVTLPETGDMPTRTLHLQRDLRDVLVVGTELWVSRFRAAEVLVVNAEGAVARTMRPAWGTPGSEAVVAWRLAAYGAGAVMIHQRAGVTPPTTPMYYMPSNECGTGMTPAELTVFMPDAPPVTSPTVRGAVLPVDVAVWPSADGAGSATFGVVASGNVGSDASLISVPSSSVGLSTPCVGSTSDSHATTVAVAIDQSRGFVVQRREPPALYVLRTGTVIAMSSDHRNDVGHELFHEATSQHIACASCHPEGGDDGHVWRFVGQGLRRTPSLRGGVLATAPYHWDGALGDMSSLMDEVLVRRMGGAAVSHDQVTAMAHWLDALPLPAASRPANPGAVARGEALFTRPDVGCVTCHGGPAMTNNQTVDVGTGAAFQVPSLRGVASRAPYMHDGCAPTLRDRFGRCGGDERHGHVSQLTEAELGDLVAYLETL